MKRQERQNFYLHFYLFLSSLPITLNDYYFSKNLELLAIGSHLLDCMPERLPGNFSYSLWPAEPNSANLRSQIYFI